MWFGDLHWMKYHGFLSFLVYSLPSVKEEEEEYREMYIKVYMLT